MEDHTSQNRSGAAPTSEPFVMLVPLDPHGAVEGERDDGASVDPQAPVVEAQAPPAVGDHPPEGGPPMPVVRLRR